MVNIILLWIAAILLIFWGVAHLFPTKSIVKGFGDISEDNKQIITMEWIIEGFSLIFIGFLIMAITIIGQFDNLVSITVYWISVVMLICLTILSLLTGFKVNFPPFKLCPVIFITAAILIIIGISI